MNDNQPDVANYGGPKGLNIRRSERKYALHIFRNYKTHEKETECDSIFVLMNVF